MFKVNALKKLVEYIGNGGTYKKKKSKALNKKKNKLNMSKKID